MLLFRINIVLLFLYCTVVLASNPYEHLHDLCQRDSQCGYQWSMDMNQDPSSFRYMVDQMMRHYDVHDMDDHDKMMLAMMKSYHYCKDPNEYFHQDHGCVCRDNKKCNINVATHLSPSKNNILVILTFIIIIFAIAYYSFKFAHVEQTLKSLQISVGTLASRFATIPSSSSSQATYSTLGSQPQRRR